MIGVCSKCTAMFETTVEDAYTPGVLCYTCYAKSKANNTPARQSTGQSMAYWIGDEEVNGFIVGGMTNTYQFWHDVRLGDGSVITEPITQRREFENDAEAGEWFRQKYPAEYAAGAEMRIYD